MKVSIVASVAAFTACSLAVDTKLHRWTPPGPYDVRGPCPGLNAAANHGFIPRSGRNIAVLDLIFGLADALNVGSDFVSSAGAGALLANPHTGATTFDLDMLATAKSPLAHGASLARDSPSSAVNPQFFAGVLRHFRDASSTSVFTAARARSDRVKEARRRDTKLEWGARQALLSCAETALYLQTMGRNTSAGEAEVEFVQVLFEQERLPYDEGWKRPEETVTLASVAEMSRVLCEVNGHEKLPNGVKFSEDTVKDALEGRNPATGSRAGEIGDL